MKKHNIYKFLKKLNKKIPKGYYVSILMKKKDIPLTKKDLSEKIWNQSHGWKPHGIWMSGKFEKNEQSWSDWCFENKLYDWIDPDKTTYYFLDISLDNVLVLDSINKIKKFHKKYGIGAEKSDIIDWIEVSKKYNGVCFYPYFKYFRKLDSYMEYSWYNMLDSASMCIWNGKNINDIKIAKITDI